MNLRISNKTLIASQEELVEGKQKTHLVADLASASGSCSVANIAGFAIGKVILLGNWGDATAEIIRLHASTAPTGQTITFASNTAYDHYTDTPITLLDYNQIEFSRATTLAGSKSILATQSIAPNDFYSKYYDGTNTTGYAFYRFKNSYDTVYSDYCTGISYSGNAHNSFEKIAFDACQLASSTLNDKYSKEADLLADANEAQNVISEKQDWSFELTEENTSLTSTENENTYALTGLTADMKFAQTYQSILDVRFGSGVLDYISIDEMDDEFEGVAQTTLAAAITAGDVTVTLTDSYEFGETGSAYVGKNKITWTANAQSTGVLSGVTGTTYDVAISANVWQDITPGTPTKYTVFNGNIILNCPIETDEAGKKIKIKFLKKLTRLTDFSSVTEVPFSTAVNYFVASKIQRRKQNTAEADRLLLEFEKRLEANLDRFKLPMLEEETYWVASNKEDSISSST